jgi:hypothetical protein
MQVRDLIEELQRFDPRDTVEIEISSPRVAELCAQPDRVVKSDGIVTIICVE